MHFLHFLGPGCALYFAQCVRRAEYQRRWRRRRIGTRSSACRCPIGFSFPCATPHCRSHPELDCPSLLHRIVRHSTGSHIWGESVCFAHYLLFRAGRNFLVAETSVSSLCESSDAQLFYSARDSVVSLQIEILSSSPSWNSSKPEPLCGCVSKWFPFFDQKFGLDSLRLVRRYFALTCRILRFI